MSSAPPAPTLSLTPAATPSKREVPAPASKKKFNNGWTKQIEVLMAEWADKAVCYRWMHEKTERIFYRADMGFMFPVIILSTLSGAGNFALDSVFSDPDHKRYAQLSLGGLSLLTGIISTIGNRLGYGGRSEAHKGAAIQWGKFQRLIAIELALHPNERIDCMGFLKMCRAELDRLIEQSPTIPESVIKACRREFTKYPKVRKPEIIGDIEKTSVFYDNDGRSKQLARDAALLIQQKKGVLKQIVLDDLEPRIQRVLEASTLPAMKETLRKEAHAATKEAVTRALAAGATSSSALASGEAVAVAATTGLRGAVSVSEVQKERAHELKAVVKSGVVSSIRARLDRANDATGGPAPAGVGSLFAELAVDETSDDEKGQGRSVVAVPVIPVETTVEVVALQPDAEKI